MSWTESPWYAKALTLIISILVIYCFVAGRTIFGWRVPWVWPFVWGGKEMKCPDCYKYIITTCAECGTKTLMLSEQECQDIWSALQYWLDNIDKKKNPQTVKDLRKLINKVKLGLKKKHKS